jgi:hypothetical protein
LISAKILFISFGETTKTKWNKFILILGFLNKSKKVSCGEYVLRNINFPRSK